VGGVRGVQSSSQKPGTPGAVEGRRHIDIQTDSFLEELTDTVPERDVNTQTDAFMDRPPTPLFVPMKVGVDCTTQIEAGDLFDFDLELEPILAVLVRPLTSLFKLINNAQFAASIRATWPLLGLIE
jgi:hypothetical protein